jgi:hypothetical protein
VDDDVDRGKLERLAQVDGERPAEPRRVAELGRDHVLARLDRLTAHLGTEVSGPAGDKKPHADVPRFTSRG